MSTDRLDFSGRVALVTGAGRGIGRAYADLLAARGAAVVVNDLGVATGGGGGQDASPATRAAEEIVARGGRAVADTSDVTTPDGAAALVSRAVDTFGRLDAVINNAGIFGVDTFPDISAEDLRRFLDVHVIGGFAVTRAAWPHLIASGRGRVVLTTSVSALGAADTVCYSTAKAAVLGLGRSLAAAGRPHGIAVNLVAPMAMTRMMSTGMGLGDAAPTVPERAPELVAPLVALLCHDSCPVTGETFVSGMRRSSRLALTETPGVTHTGLDITPELLAEHWEELSDGTGARVVASTAEWSAGNEEALAAVPVAP